MVIKFDQIIHFWTSWIGQKTYWTMACSRIQALTLQEKIDWIKMTLGLTLLPVGLKIIWTF